MLSFLQYAKILALKEAFKSLPKPRLLVDAGCGDGSLLLGSQADRRIGLDHIAPVERRIESIKCDVAVIPLKDKVADCVMCLEVIEHIEDGNRLISELYRISRDGGGLILANPNTSEFMTNKILRKILKFDTKVFHQKSGHVKIYSQVELITLAQSYHFQVLCYKNIYQPLGRILDVILYHPLLYAIERYKKARYPTKKEYSMRRNKLISSLERIHDFLFLALLAPVAALIEKKGNKGFIHFLVAKADGIQPQNVNR